MAWPPKVDAKELLGLSKEEFESKVAEINTALSQAKTATAAAEAATTQVTAIQEQMAKLEGRLTAPQPVANTMINNQDAPFTRWDEDAEKAFNERMAGVVTPLVQVAMNTQAKMAFSEVAARMGAKDSKYKLVQKLAQELVLKQPIGLQVREDIIENCFKVTLADNFEQIAKDQQARSGSFYMESAINVGQPTVEDTRLPEEKLSQREKDIAAKMGISAKAYAEAKSTMIMEGV